MDLQLISQRMPGDAPAVNGKNFLQPACCGLAYNISASSRVYRSGILTVDARPTHGSDELRLTVMVSSAGDPQQ